MASPVTIPPSSPTSGPLSPLSPNLPASSIFVQGANSPSHVNPPYQSRFRSEQRRQRRPTTSMSPVRTRGRAIAESHVGEDISNDIMGFGGSEKVVGRRTRSNTVSVHPGGVQIGTEVKAFSIIPSSSTMSTVTATSPARTRGARSLSLSLGYIPYRIPSFSRTVAAETQEEGKTSLLLSLPTELILDILEMVLLAPQPPKQATRLQPIFLQTTVGDPHKLAVSHTSLTLALLSQQILYRTVVLDTPTRLSVFARTLTSVSKRSTEHAGAQVAGFPLNPALLSLRALQTHIREVIITVEMELPSSSAAGYRPHANNRIIQASSLMNNIPVRNAHNLQLARDVHSVIQACADIPKLVVKSDLLAAAMQMPDSTRSSGEAGIEKTKPSPKHVTLDTFRPLPLFPTQASEVPAACYSDVGQFFARTTHLRVMHVPQPWVRPLEGLATLLGPLPHKLSPLVFSHLTHLALARSAHANEANDELFAKDVGTLLGYACGSADELTEPWMGVGLPCLESLIINVVVPDGYKVTRERNLLVEDAVKPDYGFALREEFLGIGLPPVTLPLPQHPDPNEIDFDEDALEQTYLFRLFAPLLIRDERLCLVRVASYSLVHGPSNKSAEGAVCVSFDALEPYHKHILSQRSRGLAVDAADREEHAYWSEAMLRSTAWRTRVLSSMALNV